MSADNTPSLDREQRIDAAAAAYLRALDAGSAPDAPEFLARYPDLAPELGEFLADCRRLENLAGPAESESSLLESQEPTFANKQDAPPSSSITPPEGPQSARTVWPRIAGYEVLLQLGKGGMGVVYQARHLALNRTVALKMIRGTPGRDEMSRFRREAEAVARLQHPNIVQIYEVGEENGSPYLSLEYIDGGSLASRLDGTPWPAVPAARLMETVARAIQAAHERGIVHRDLKPANILLVSGGVVSGEWSNAPDATAHHSLTTHHPKIADFGLAKYLDQDASHSYSGAIIGTPSYMPPEQAEGRTKGIGPTADVYSLGAILYELLTGRPPFKAPTSVETVLQVIHDEPVAPSRLQPKVPRDLETICLKCLSKEAGRRYGSAAALAEDLRRFQASEPILARPVGKAEWVWRWCRRNPAAAAAACTGLLALSLLVGAAMSMYFALQAQDRAAEALREKTRADDKALAEEEAKRRAEQERERSVLEARKTAALADVFVKGIQFDDPLGLSGHFVCVPRVIGQQLSAEAILQRGAKRTAGEVKQDWQVEATVCDAIGNVYRTLGMYPEAESQLRSAVELRRQNLPANSLELAISLRNLAVLYHQRSNSELGDYEQAILLYQQALTIRQNQPAPDDLLIADVKYYQAWLYTQMEDYVKAEKLFDEVLALRRKHLDKEHRDVILTQVGLVGVKVGRGDYLRGTIEIIPAVLAMVKREGDQDLQKIVELFVQGLFLNLSDRLREARETLQACEALVRKWGGDQHLYVAAVLNARAEVSVKLGDLDQAEKEYEQCLEISRRTVGYEHQITSFVVLKNYARLLFQRGKRAEADVWLGTFRRAWEDRYGKGDFQLANFLMTQADLLEEWNDAVSQESVCRQARALYDRYGGARFRLYAECLTSQATACLRQHKLGEAEALLREALPLARAQARYKPDLPARVLTNLAAALLAAQKFADVESLLLEAIAIHKQAAPSSLLPLLGMAVFGRKPKPANPTEPPRPGGLPDALAALSLFYRHSGRHAEAAARLREQRRLCANDAGQLYQTAGAFVDCARLAQTAAAHPQQGTVQACQDYLDEALIALGDAIDAGYANLALLEKDPGIDLLRSRPEFPALLKRLQAKHKPGRPDPRAVKEVLPVQNLFEEPAWQ